MAGEDHELRLHRVREEDWRSHRDLRLEMLQDAPDAFWTTLADVAGRVEADWRRATHGGHFLQARRGQEVLGGLGIIAEPYEPHLPLAEDTVNLVAMYVAPRARGTGVGDLLVAGAKEVTGGLGRRRILLEVTSNNEAAQRLYVRHGFRFTGATTPHPRRSDLVEREMVWEGAGSATAAQQPADPLAQVAHPAARQQPGVSADVPRK